MNKDMVHRVVHVVFIRAIKSKTNAWAKRLAKDQPSWDSFWDEVYEGGKKRVPNPNPDTKSQYPEVAASTAIKNAWFYDQVQKEFLNWLERQEKEPEDTRPKLSVSFGAKGSIQNLNDLAKLLNKSPTQVLEESFRTSGAQELRDLGYEVQVEIKSVSLSLGFVEISISADPIQDMIRKIYFKDKKIYNDSLFLDEGAPAGLGTKILASQVQEARKLGMKRLACWAGRDIDMVGYYVWPLLGYQGYVDKKFLREEFEYSIEETLRRAEDETEEEKQRLERLVKLLTQFMKKHLQGPGSISVQEFMKTPEGREVWKEFGVGGNMEFDLQDGSDSMRIFQEYLQKKGIHKKLGAASKKGIPIESILLEDESILVEVWSS